MAGGRSESKRGGGCVVWLTGLSGSGKTTLGHGLERRLLALGRPCTVLDGDLLRRGLNADLGYSPADRAENVRRIGEVAALFADAGLVAIVTAISPYAADRDRARHAAGTARFLEVHLDVPLAVCEARDPKGLYAKARAGQIPDFTGIDAPYEPPARPELRLDTATVAAEDCVERLLALLRDRGFAPPEARRS